MKFNEHLNLQGKHAFLSASQSAWLNYSTEKLRETYNNLKAKEKGTELHELASKAIQNRIKLDNRSKNSLNMFVNDAIGYRMESEKVLYYSDYCFGTADAISYTENDDGIGLLRIFDLKTGYIKAKFRQLKIYAALFCLEYGKDPSKMEIELRIYQSGEVLQDLPEPEEIKDIMNIIMKLNREIVKLETE